MRYTANENWCSCTIGFDAAAGTDPVHLAAREHYSIFCLITAVALGCSLQHEADRFSIVEMDSFQDRALDPASWLT